MSAKPAQSWQDALMGIAADLTHGEELPQQPEQKKSTKLPRLDIELDRKGRAGKTATIVSGFADGTTDEEISKIAATLKKKLGTGGSARGGEILIQGDRRKDVAEILATQGYKTRII